MEIRKLVQRHPDVLWSANLVLAAVSGTRAWQAAKDKKPTWAVTNTLLAIWSMVSAVNSLRLISQQPKFKKVEVSEEMRQTIKAAIEATRAKKDIL